MVVCGFATGMNLTRKLSIRFLDWQSLIGTLWSNKKLPIGKVFYWKFNFATSRYGRSFFIIDKNYDYLFTGPLLHLFNYRNNLLA